ncbi:MAG: hypothetical protein L6Q33_02955 [Bacteriovoracaceae bacterium]|jgi:hypothetical protein|nr:hypothetical protein [Bacteriovoracaceae bacterium]
MIDQTQQLSTIDTTWIESLALEELNMEESGIVNITGHLNPELMLEESSIKFMNNLKDKFELYVNTFNRYRTQSGATTGIKMFKISNTVNDFMLFRNSLRLVFARKANDCISIGFIANGKDIFAARLSINDRHGSQSMHELRAHVGAFGKITWRFNGEPVDVDSLVRHYLTEFIVNSAR